MQFESLELSPTADFHVHLRDDSLMRMVVPTIKEGGVDTVYVMVCFLTLIFVQPSEEILPPLISLHLSSFPNS